MGLAHAYHCPFSAEKHKAQRPEVFSHLPGSDWHNITIMGSNTPAVEPGFNTHFIDRHVQVLENTQ